MSRPKFFSKHKIIPICLFFPTACWTRAEDLCWNTISVTNKQNFKSYNQSVLIRTLNGYNGEICLQENGCKLTKTCLPDYTVAEDSPRSYYCNWNGIWNDNLFGTKEYCPVCRSGNFVIVCVSFNVVKKNYVPQSTLYIITLYLKGYNV